MYIRSIRSALPKFSADNLSILQAAKIWLNNNPNEMKIFERFLSASHTVTRHFIMPPSEIVTQNGQHKRAEIFLREGSSLATEAAASALIAAGISASEIDAIIFTSCSCPTIPAIDVEVIERLKLKRDILRIPSYQFGCAGGLIGLGLATKFDPSIGNILVISCEICSLVFQASNSSASNLVGAAIFGDGAAAAVISREPTQNHAFRIVDRQSYLIPETRFLMGYDIQDSGAHLRLDKELPAYLTKYAPTLVDDFLARHKLTRSQVPWWLFHPGGVKILNSLNQIFNLSPLQSHWASDVLSDTGNISSATIMMVLQRFLSDDVAVADDPTLMIGVGPGLTIELILGRYQIS